MTEASGRLSRGRTGPERARVRETIEKLENGTAVERRIASELREQIDAG